MASGHVFPSLGAVFCQQLNKKHSNGFLLRLPRAMGRCGELELQGVLLRCVCFDFTHLNTQQRTSLFDCFGCSPECTCIENVGSDVKGESQRAVLHVVIREDPEAVPGAAASV